MLVLLHFNVSDKSKRRLSKRLPGCYCAKPFLALVIYFYLNRYREYHKYNGRYVQVLFHASDK